MTSDPRYFRPRNWSKFQSRSNNSMAWIKLQTSLLSDPDFLALNPASRAVWCGVLLLCGRDGRVMPLSSSYISGQLNVSRQQARASLDTFLANDFIELCDRTSNLHEKLPSLEKKREDKKRKERTPPPPSGGSPPHSNEMINGKKGTRLAGDWRPTPEHGILAGKLGVCIDRETERFHDYWKAKTGKDATKLDWDATFRNWLRRASEYKPRETADSKRTRRRAGLSAAVSEFVDTGLRTDTTEGEGGA